METMQAPRDADEVIASRVRADRAMRIGIDFGGTKIEAAAIGDDGAPLARVRLPNPGDYDAALDVLATLVDQVEREVGGVGSVGIGTPGSISPRSGMMRNANSVYLNGRTLREDVEHVLRRPVRLANDANCFALSEAVDGAAAGRGSVFGLIIGTGCGGGLVIDGHLVEGAHGVAAEVGHVPLPWPDAGEAAVDACWCGQRGCLESWISGTGFARAHHAATGETLGSPQIVAAAMAGEPGARASLDAYIDRLGRALALVVNLVDPQAIVLGGGMSNVAALYPALPEVIRRNIFSDMWEGEVLPARWGDSSGVRGAAWLWD